MIAKYNLYATTNFGDYRFRIIVPFFEKRKLITFSSIDATGKSSVKYVHAPKEKSVKDPKNALYNIDNCHESVVLVEGLFDCWRIGDGAISLMGTKYTDNQVNQVIESNFKKILVMLDADAIGIGYQLADQLAPFTDVDVIEILRGDPDELPDKYVQMVKGWLK